MILSIDNILKLIESKLRQRKILGKNDQTMEHPNSLALAMSITFLLLPNEFIKKRLNLRNPDQFHYWFVSINVSHSKLQALPAERQL